MVKMKTPIAVLGGAAFVLALGLAVETRAVIDHTAPPSAVAVQRPLGGFPVNPSWVRLGTPNFRGTEVVRSPDGKSVTGLWACDGPSTFEWQFGGDETVHLLEGRVEVEYLGRRFTLNPGDTATFHSDTRAVWHVPEYAKKVYTVQETGRLVRLWRKLFPPQTTV